MRRAAPSFSRKGCDDRALIELRLAISLGGDDAPTLLNLALAEQRAGDARRAEGLMRDLERRFDDWDEPPLRLAELARSAGRGAEAEEAYRRVLEVNPKRPEALIGLAALLLARGESGVGANPVVALLRHRAGQGRSMGRAGPCPDDDRRRADAPSRRSRRRIVSRPLPSTTRCGGSRLLWRRVRPRGNSRDWSSHRARIRSTAFC